MFPVFKNYLTIALFYLLASPAVLCSQKKDHFNEEAHQWKAIRETVIDSLEVLPFSVLQYSLKMKCSDTGTKGNTFIKFYDASKRELLKYKSGPVTSQTFQETGYYTEAPPFTKYATVGIEKDSSGKGWLTADSFKIELNIGVSPVKQEPLCDLDEYMHPFWNSDTIYNETVLMYGESGQTASGKLLFVPDHIISVQRFDLAKEFKPGGDYTMRGKTITRTNQSETPYRTKASFDEKNDLAWFDLQSQWVVVTYTHHDKWPGPVPSFKGAKLPLLMAKLKSKSPVKIIGYGMSITRGLNISSYDHVAPYMPTYLDLFARQMKKNYQYEEIKMINAGLPGAFVSWGAAYAEKYVNPVQADLVIIDFGMNDFWRYTPAEFKEYIQTIISKVKSGNPNSEFLLISNMDFDPAYILDSDKNKTFYTSNLRGYNKVLQELETRGIINLDMMTLSNAIYSRKKAKDCISNPLHPNDYLARWYAQALVALLSGKE